jgi:hypothetical protein
VPQPVTTASIRCRQPGYAAPKKRQTAPTSASLILQVMRLSVLALVTQLVAALLILSGSRKIASVPAAFYFATAIYGYR